MLGSTFKNLNGNAKDVWFAMQCSSVEKSIKFVITSTLICSRNSVAFSIPKRINQSNLYPKLPLFPTNYNCKFIPLQCYTCLIEIDHILVNKLYISNYYLTLFCMLVIQFLSLSLNSITRTFASGRTEKMVMQCLKELGLPGGKVRMSYFTVTAHL